ncbi:PKD domain-containing protein [Candidatus Pacearchaeota archaeon]|nr:PKD domain-containing protein [Candidatus Pacearchaeota archaeon]
MKIKSISLFVVIFVLFFSVFVQATIDIGNKSHEIKDYYGVEAQIDGWINVSLENEDSDILLKDSMGGQIGFLDLLKSLTGIKYSCLPIGCTVKYEVSSPASQKTLNLGAGETAVVGFKITGETYGVDSIDFTLESDVGESCYNQLKIDLLLDDTIEFSNNKSDTGICLAKEGDGCFNSSKEASEIGIGAITPFCQKMYLPEAPSINVGAWVKRVSGDINLTMWIHRDNGIAISDANCLLPQASMSGGRISCLIDYPITEAKDYFICVTPEDKIDGDYKLKGYAEDEENACGFHKEPSGNTRAVAAYEIFFKARKFASVGTVQISNAIGVEESLSARATDYLIEKYGSSGEDGETVCPEDGCIIPMKIISKISQQVKLNGLSFKYKSIIGLSDDNKFYDITESASKLTTDGFQIISLKEAGFLVGDSAGKIDYNITLGETEVFEEEISIESVPVINGIFPSKTAFGYPTEFEIKLSSTRNMSSYFLDFGDGKNTTSVTNLIIHTYNQSGSYSITASVVDVNNRSATKVFSILVETPEDFIKSELDEAKLNLEKIKSDISVYPDFYQTQIKDALLFNDYEEELKARQREFSQTFGDEPRLLALVTKILDFSVPKSLEVSAQGDGIVFYPQAADIDLAALSDVAGGAVPTGSQKYIDAILGWNQETMDMKIDYLQLSINIDENIEPFIRFFDVTFKKLKSDNKDPVVIIDKVEGLSFGGNTVVSDDGSSYVSSRLSGETTTMLFSTTADVDFASLPMFVSLPLDYVPVSSETGEAPEPEGPRWVILILIFILLAIIAGLVYIFLQVWYKRKYEKYLFPNKTDLYNLVSFIQTSRKKGMKESDIKKSLSKSGWSGEHISYAMKKHAGKRTGMIEIPGGAILDKMSKKEKPASGDISMKNRPLGRLGMRPRAQRRPVRPRRPAGARRPQARSAGLGSQAKGSKNPVKK